LITSRQRACGATPLARAPIKRTDEDRLVGHISRDATAIDARKKPMEAATLLVETDPEHQVAEYLGVAAHPHILPADIILDAPLTRPPAPALLI